MAALGVGSGQLLRRHALANIRRRCSSCADQHVTKPLLSFRYPLQTPIAARNFSSRYARRPRFSQRLGEALRNSKITWYHIPVGVGIGFLGLVQFYKVTAREQEKRRQEDGGVSGGQPKRRERIRPDGPCLDEVSEPDLHAYPNLAAFFYRTLKPGARPLDPDSHALLSPSDGKILQYGRIEGGDIEQVKGMTYSVDALLGKNTPTASIASGQSSASARRGGSVAHGDEEIVKQEEEFAKMNGISYTLPDLLSGQADAQKPRPATDESTEVSARAVSEVRAELALGEKPWYDIVSADKSTSLYYAVIYLAPGDYHRFHSPTNWVVERRRHFAGELYSVSPYLQRTLPGLFTLNERVVLLGRWRYGFFSYVPVGATNVGSIKINFDRELRTNSLLTDTAADHAAEEAAKRGEPYMGFSEATYEEASSVLHGHALRRGEEMGGFQLGSTIVLVFEAPSEKEEGGKPISGWHWAVEKGQTIKMGQALGRIVED
ncbi:phosphatidylserine decarboxylase proenzyme 1 precursor [Metarhizium acridum CQMa 102]|uniref:Phosphatidylserine decarboxylase proenzyme 1, mitochondrial n=1 Tax=Metarhizium acridum (strain CQMa 102) TaxID=655827 RepID=E9EFD6_METAQ|nr:phosphatidylserine decarboxylase proenzyme 1 precursor [Metarhizium acridum CQMa 102]EFY85389.1 phosphatidylserine decarboxylase proenzyme 1 precursor [Metarhizium acridum CQMa 102]